MLFGCPNQFFAPARIFGEIAGAQQLDNPKLLGHWNWYQSGAWTGGA
jgi:hypothetical protein